jgi:hypothetical protein
MNIKKFLNLCTDPSKLYWSEPTTDDALILLKDWYTKHTKEIYDFGYTLNLIRHSSKYKESNPDYRIKALYIDNKIVNLCIWGKLTEDTSVFLVCKSKNDINQYIGDYARYKAYNEMKLEGYTFINDGSDLGLDGLKKYKTKFRPVKIENIYELTKMVD